MYIYQKIYRKNKHVFSVVFSPDQIIVGKPWGLANPTLQAVVSFSKKAEAYDYAKSIKITEKS